MSWVALVTVLASAQFFVFGALVSVARVKLNVPAPMMTGPAAFERINRVHLNTQERLVLFLPLLWLAAQSWPAAWVAGLGGVYLIGRLLYWRGYVNNPQARTPGNIITMLPIGVLLLANLATLVRGVL